MGWGNSINKSSRQEKKGTFGEYSLIQCDGSIQEPGQVQWEMKLKTCTSVDSRTKSSMKCYVTACWRRKWHHLKFTAILWYWCCYTNFTAEKTEAERLSSLPKVTPWVRAKVCSQAVLLYHTHGTYPQYIILIESHKLEIGSVLCLRKQESYF